MKLVIDRQEVAQYMNFHKYPVLSIDWDTPKSAVKATDEYPGSTYWVGSCLDIAWNNPRYPDMTTHCELFCEVGRGDGKLHLGRDCTCLSSSFGYSDVMGMLAQANTPVANPGDTVVVVEIWSKKKQCRLRIMKVSERVDHHCMTVATLEDIEE